MQGTKDLPISTSAVVAEIAAILAQGYLRQRMSSCSELVKNDGGISDKPFDNTCEKSFHAHDG